MYTNSIFSAPKYWITNILLTFHQLENHKNLKIQIKTSHKKMQKIKTSPGRNKPARMRRQINYYRMNNYGSQGA